MLHDLRSHLTPKVLIGPAVLTDDNTPVEIDLKDYGNCMINLFVGIGGITFTNTNKIEMKVNHGSTSGSLVAVDAGDINGIDAADLTAGAISNGIIKSFKAAHAAAAFYSFNYIGGERYIELLADFGGTHGTGTPIFAEAILGRPAFSTNVAAADLKAS